MLFDLLQANCMNDNGSYIVNNASFKKGTLNNTIPPYIESLHTYYHNSKKNYIERKQTYTTFLTIVRQICKHNIIQYTTRMVYDKSKYEIVYYICRPQSASNNNI